MSPQIEEIERFGPSLRARRVRLSDGSERTTSAAAVKELGLESGMSLTREGLESRLEAIEPALVRDRALRLLGYRERSVSDLTKRLEQDGYPREHVASVVSTLQHSGLVDDERFAELLVRTRVSAGYARRRVERELAEHGVDPDIAAAAVAAYCPKARETESLIALLPVSPPETRKERERLLRKLVGRGFEYRDVLDSLARIGADVDEPFADEVDGSD